MSNNIPNNNYVVKREGSGTIPNYFSNNTNSDFPIIQFGRNNNTSNSAPKKSAEQIAREKALKAAEEFWKAYDDNVGTNCTKKMQKLLDTQVDSAHIMDFLDEYEKHKHKHTSIIATVTGVKMASGSDSQKNVLKTIMRKLSEAAKNAGVSQDEIQKANNDFWASYDREYKSGYGSVRATNPKDMEKAMDSLRGAIVAKMKDGGNISKEDAIEQVKGMATEDHNAAAREYNQAREKDGWCAKAGDTICGWFGCNTIEDLNKKFGNRKEFVQALVNSKSEEEFCKIYKEGLTTPDGKKIPGTGLDFDAQKIAAMNKAQGDYMLAVNLNQTIKTCDEAIQNENSYTVLENILVHRFGYDRSTIKEIINAYNTDNEDISSSAQKSKMLVRFFNDIKANSTQNLDSLRNGKTIEQMGEDVELITKNVLGDDIGKDVAQFNENMVITEMVTEGAAEIIGTIALQFVPGLGQLAMGRLAASAGRWGSRAVKVARYAAEAEKTLGKVQQVGQGASKLGKTGQVAGQMVNAGVATAAVDLSNGKSVKDAAKKALMNMSFAGVGASSSILAPKLMQTFGIADRKLATEIAEEIINAAGSFGVVSMTGGEYGKTDAFIDFASGLIISRLSHVKGGNNAPKSAKTTHQNSQPDIAGYHKMTVDGVEYEFPILQNADGTTTIDVSVARIPDGNGGYNAVVLNTKKDTMSSGVENSSNNTTTPKSSQDLANAIIHDTPAQSYISEQERAAISGLEMHDEVENVLNKICEEIKNGADPSEWMFNKLLEGKDKHLKGQVESALKRLVAKDKENNIRKWSIIEYGLKYNKQKTKDTNKPIIGSLTNDKSFRKRVEDFKQQISSNPEEVSTAKPAETASDSTSTVQRSADSSSAVSTGRNSNIEKNMISPNIEKVLSKHFSDSGQTAIRKVLVTIGERVSNGEKIGKELLDDIINDTVKGTGVKADDLKNYVFDCMSLDDNWEEFIPFFKKSAGKQPDLEELFIDNFKLSKPAKTSEKLNDADIGLNPETKTKPAQEVGEVKGDNETKVDTDAKAKRNADIQKAKEYCEKYPDIADFKEKYGSFFDGDSTKFEITIGEIKDKYEAYLKENPMNYDNFNSTALSQLIDYNKFKFDRGIELFNDLKAKYHPDIIAEELRIKGTAEKFKISDDQVIVSDNIIEQIRTKQANNEPISLSDIDDMLYNADGIDKRASIQNRLRQRILTDQSINDYLNENFNTYVLTDEKCISLLEGQKPDNVLDVCRDISKAIDDKTIKSSDDLMDIINKRRQLSGGFSSYEIEVIKRVLENDLKIKTNCKDYIDDIINYRLY